MSKKTKFPFVTEVKNKRLDNILAEIDSLKVEYQKFIKDVKNSPDVSPEFAECVIYLAKGDLEVLRTVKQVTRTIKRNNKHYRISKKHV